MIKKTKKRSLTRRTGRGTVMIIAALLSTSAFLRLGSGAGEAVAEAIIQPTPPVGFSKEGSEVSDIANTRKVDRAKIGSLLAALMEREARVSEREERIAKRQKALEIADEEIERRMVALEQIEQDLRKTLALANGAAESDLARLTAVYENMKPKDSAKLFETMEPEFAAGFLGRMRPDAAAGVMAGLSPEAAYSISVILAGRNASAPKS
mgnify:CR=1 FL=1|tara:strand:- start:798 stop:1424 length:627 start_codon:yes stop_codon:yes gene_type:complete